MTATPLTRDDFWALIAELDWASNPDTDTVKMKVMARGPEFVDAFSDHYEAVRGELARACVAAGYDYCYDSWDDVRAHVVGLGREEWEAAVANPERVIERLNRGDFRESFSYCVPWSGSFEDWSEGKLLERVQDLIEGYRDAISRFPALSEDLVWMVTNLECQEDLGELLVNKDEMKARAEKIEKAAKAAITAMLPRNSFHCWSGGDPATNKWAVWNTLSDAEKVLTFNAMKAAA